TKLVLLLAIFVTHFLTTAWAAEVVIPDAALKAAIWRTLGKPDPVGSLSEQDMLSLTSLQACCQGVRSVEGLGFAHNLTTLALVNNYLQSITLPAGLTNLMWLDLSINQLRSLTVPDDLTSLTTLNLSYNGMRPHARSRRPARGVFPQRYRTLLRPATRPHAG